MLTYVDLLSLAICVSGKSITKLFVIGKLNYIYISRLPPAWLFWKLGDFSTEIWLAEMFFLPQRHKYTIQARHLIYIFLLIISTYRLK